MSGGKSLANVPPVNVDSYVPKGVRAQENASVLGFLKTKESAFFKDFGRI